MNRLLILSILALAPFLLSPSVVSAEAACKHQTRILSVPDPVSGRKYRIQVSLPDDFSYDRRRSWPLLILTDGPRAFRTLACLGRALARKNEVAIDPVIVGLSYALNEDRENSRRRDYTPVPRLDSALTYGGAGPYKNYLRDVVLARVEAEFNTDPEKRIFWGHSYGALLGAYMLLTQPNLFQTWILGSPSFWYEEGAIYAFEEAYARGNTRLDAQVLFYVGGKEVRRYVRARRGYTRDMVAGVRKFKARLQARKFEGLSLKSTVLSGLNHVTAVPPGFEWALRTAFPVVEEEPVGVNFPLGGR